jgi:hypothetical protein
LLAQVAAVTHVAPVALFPEAVQGLFSLILASRSRYCGHATDRVTRMRLSHPKHTGYTRPPRSLVDYPHDWGRPRARGAAFWLLRVGGAVVPTRLAVAADDGCSRRYRGYLAAIGNIGHKGLKGPHGLQ